MKRFLAAFLMICTMLSLNTVVFARENNQKSVEYIAQNWIDSHYSGDAKVSKIVSLYNTNNECIGQLVSFVKDDTPAGYIVLSHAERENPIIEYAFEGQSVYDYLENQFVANQANIVAERQKSSVTKMVSSYSIAEENVLYTDFINYSLKIKNGDETLLFNQNRQIQIFTDNKVATNKSPATDKFFEGYVDYPSESDSYDFDSIPGAYSSSALIMGNMPGVSSGEGNCGPTSLANTVKLYAENGLNGHSELPGLRLNGSDADTYSRLVTLSGYSSSDAASMSELLNALDDYSDERGYSCSIDNYWWDLWSDFTRDIGKDKPILLYTSSSAGTAHAQVVVGYRSYDNGAKYLRIFTGWSSSATFVKFKPDSLNHFNGYCVAISN